jgi:hypothetical protein
VTLSEACAAKGVEAGDLALHLGVHVTSARRWLAGGPIPERHAKALPSLLGRENVRALAHLFVPPRPRGPRGELAPALERAARALRRAAAKRRGDLELAARLEERATK